MEEVWKPIEGTDGKYEVSNFGHVRTNGKRPGLLTLTKQPKGYLYAMIQLSNGKQKNCRVHRLVAEHFLPNPNNLPCINHIDGNKLNNHVSNLEWCTYQANMQHAVSTGLTHPHQWTDEERKHISERNKQYAINHGYQPKPHRTMAEYQTERRAKAEERRQAKALMPKPSRKKGWKWSDEARQRASQRQTGKPHPRKSGTKGWKWSEEARQSFREKKKAYYERKRRGSE